MEPVWVKESVVIAIHRRQLAEYGGIEGIRNEGLLESALFRPQNKFYYENPTIFELAAAYGYGIVKNHPFLDGNKRTSYIVKRTFLKLNSHDIQASEIEKYDMWIGLASGLINEDELSTWIEDKSVKA